MKSSKKRVIDTLKLLSLDMISKAKCGDAISILRNANVFYSLYSGGLIFNQKDPLWINRDRFIMANENCMPLYYATQYMAGEDIEYNDLKKFNQRNAKLQLKNALNKENGIAYAVGVALAQQHYESMLKDKTNNIINYNTYVFCNINDIKKGVSHEALMVASSNNLNKLVILCDCEDNNDIEIESLIDFYNFKVIKVISNNVESLNNILDKTHDTKKPTIILLKNELPKNELTMLNNNKISEEELAKLRSDYKVCSVPFEILVDDIEYFKEKIDKHSKEEYELWQKDYETFKNKATKEQKEVLSLLERKEDDFIFDSDKYKVNATYAEKLSKTNNAVINILSKKYLNLISCSTDFKLTETKIDKIKENNIELANIDLAFAQIVSGLSSENLITIGSTSLVNAPKLIDGIKIGIERKIPSILVFTQDSIFSSANANQPIYEENLLRMIPDLTVFRPCDINEIFGCYEYALKHRKTICILVGNDVVPKYENTNPKFVQYGAYMIKKEQEKLDAVIVSSGSEIKKAMDISTELSKQNIELRVVSMPSVDLFECQKENYEKLLLPNKTPIIILEPSNRLIWNRFATNNKSIISIDNYCNGKNKEQLEEENKYQNEDIINKIKELL